MKKYQIIYADPPWSYRNYSNQWHKDNPKSRWVGNQYNTMSIKEIKSLPIQDISDDNCVLFLWTTPPNLDVAFEVIKAWGFNYKTKGFSWVKRNKKVNSLFWGMGFWTRANTEDCLLCTKGKPKRVDAGVHQVIESPIREHSRKPDEARDRIVKLLGDLPRIELFAREKTEGWDVWGNEVESDIDLINEEKK